MNKAISELLAALTQHDSFNTAISSKLVGIEKESLRVSHNGELSNSNHPKALGASLTNPCITTDYAESQLELITRPYNTAKQVLQELDDIHKFIYNHIGSNQLLWPSSIPGNLPHPKDIITAKFGKSLSAKFKELYRTGLGYRYGKIMQLICGIHYNFSLSKDFWHLFFNYSLNHPQWDQNDINIQYMNIIRNYIRNGWLVSYLFGSSPVINSSFVSKDIATANYLKPFKHNTYIASFGTSLRSSNSLGYHNKNHVDLMISYNSISDYAKSLLTAMTTEDKEFAKIGQYRHEKAIQLNCNNLQIENEYYGKIRPKPDKNINQVPLYKALNQYGIAYIELRNIDLNPYSPIGIEYNQCLLLELLVYYCLFMPSPEFTIKERAQIKSNNDKVCLLGRQPGLLLSKNNTSITLTQWATDILNELQIIAKYFDKTKNTNIYTETVNKFQTCVDNPNLLPSNKIHQEILNNNIEYTDLFLNKAKEHHDYFNSQPLSADKISYYQKIADDSWQKTKEIEENDKKSNLTLEQFVNNYYCFD